MESSKPQTEKRQSTGLILAGGGARAAYQVGVLRAISDILPPKTSNPFDIICGTSAGAINAATLATRAQSFNLATRNLEHVWSNFTTNMVFRTDLFDMLRSVFRMAYSLVLGKSNRKHPAAIFNNAPLRELLLRVMPFDKIQSNIEKGLLQAVSITVSAYGSGESISFYQAHPAIKNWERARRIGVKDTLSLDHLMASSAIPIFFPSVKINGHYYCDGAVRQLAPISPALHLGAERIMVIGVKGKRQPQKDRKLTTSPTMAQIIAHILNSVFLDSMEADVERLQRINHTISHIPNTVASNNGITLHSVDTLIIEPSEEVDEIAKKHRNDLPRVLRFFLGRTGATRSSGSSLLSYLLFEKGFCRELIALGYKDAMNQKEKILTFLK